MQDYTNNVKNNLVDRRQAYASFASSNLSPPPTTLISNMRSVGAGVPPELVRGSSCSRAFLLQGSTHGSMV